MKNRRALLAVMVAALGAVVASAQSDSKKVDADSLKRSLDWLRRLDSEKYTSRGHLLRLSEEGSRGSSWQACTLEGDGPGREVP